MNEETAAWIATATRITPEREACAVHGIARVVYDLQADAWRCVAPGPHYQTARNELPPSMAADLKRLGIDLAGDDNHG